jgi:anti-sigma-K factor RskA
MNGTAHDRLGELTGLYVLGGLTPDERAEFEAHLAECPVCAQEVASFAPVTAALAELLPERGPSPTLRDRVLASVRSAAPIESAPIHPTPQRTSRWRPAMVLPWLAAAAALVIAAVTSVNATRLRARIEALEAGLREANARAAEADREIVGLRRAAADAQSTVGILSAPDLARIELQGQPAAPRARARAVWSRSRGLVVTASDLPALPPGKTYQLWVVTSAAPISAGLLEPDPTGRVSAVIATPPDLPTPVAMAVTLEPSGGVPAPTGERYLVGTPSTAL